MSFYKDKKVAVLGGAGFVGSHLAEMLHAEGARVRVLDDLSNGKIENLAKIAPDFEFFKLDLRNYQNCLKAVDSQDYVFNLTAKVANVQYNREHQPEMFEENILLQMYPIKAAHEKGVKKFLQTSTVCVYPNDAVIPTPESEGERGRPENTNEGYGWAKRMGEVLARFYSERGLPTVVSRFTNVYGPRDYFDLENGHVIPSFIIRCLAEKKVVAWGTGEQMRSFLYVEDAARGLMKIMEKAETSEPINVGGCEMVSMKHLLDIVVKLLGTENEIVWDTSKPNGHERRESDVTRLKEATGWVSNTSLEKGIKETINWWKVQSEVK